MTLIGFVLLIAGLGGAAVNYFGIMPMTGVLAGMKLWIGLAVIGGVVIMLNRRTAN